MLEGAGEGEVEGPQETLAVIMVEGGVTGLHKEERGEGEDQGVTQI